MRPAKIVNASDVTSSFVSAGHVTVTGIVSVTRWPLAPSAIAVASYLPAAIATTVLSPKRTARPPMMRTNAFGISFPDASNAFTLNAADCPALSVRLAGSATSLATGAGTAAGATGACCATARAAGIAEAIANAVRATPMTGSLASVTIERPMCHTPKGRIRPDQRFSRAASKGTMQLTGIRRNLQNRSVAVLAAVLASLTACATGPAYAQARPQTAERPAPPTANYWAYVGAESADEIYRIRFGPGGTAIEKTIVVGELPAEMEGPHGLQITSDGNYLHMTTGHGFPDGKYWVYLLGPDTAIAPGISLGNFPASLDLSPDGRYMFSANFNLHGDMVPSSISVVYVPTMTEIARIVTCTMPHGSRISPDGTRQYSGCMMDDELVEIDTKEMKVARRFHLAKGKEGPLDPTGGEMLAQWIEGTRRISDGKTSDPAEVGYAAMGGHKHAMVPNSCSPTWAQPSATGEKIYVACNKADEILEIDRDAWSVTRRFKTGRGPYNLAVTADGSMLVATLKQGAQFEIFDLKSGMSVAQLATSTTVAHGVALSGDSRYAFVSSEGVGAAPGKVDVFDLRARAKVGTVDVGQQAGGITFWKSEPIAKQ